MAVTAGKVSHTLNLQYFGSKAHVHFACPDLDMSEKAGGRQLQKTELEMVCASSTKVSEFRESHPFAHTVRICSCPIHPPLQSEESQ